MQLQPNTIYEVIVSVPAIGFNVTTGYLTSEEPALYDNEVAIADYILWYHGVADHEDWAEKATVQVFYN